jgi:hypothetical protein
LEESPLLPHLEDAVTARGFQGLDFYSGTFPQSIAVPDWALLIATLLATLGGGLLITGAVKAFKLDLLRGPAGVPLLFGLLAFGATLFHHEFFDRYLLTLVPTAILVLLLYWPGSGWAVPVARVGLVLLACWSITWEREYFERRIALWQAAQSLVERGIPADQINGGWEWNGWSHGMQVIADSVKLGKAEQRGRQLQTYIFQTLRMRDARWSVRFAPLPDRTRGQVLFTVPYGAGHHVYAVERS